MKLKKILIISIVLLITVFIAGYFYYQIGRQVPNSIYKNILDTSPEALVPASISKKDRAAQLIRAGSVLQVNNIGHWQAGQWTLFSPNGNFLAVRTNKEQVALYDLRVVPPTLIDTGISVQISAGFTSDNSGLWVGTNDGRIQWFDLSSLKPGRIIQIAKGNRLDEIALSPDGKTLGWFDGEKRTAGLFDLERQLIIRTWSDIGLLGVPSQQRHIEFTQDSRYFIFFYNPPVSIRSEGGLIVWNVTEDKSEAILDAYVSYRTPAYTLANSGLYYGTRKDGPYEIRRWDFSKRAETIVDPAARNIHFIDLFASTKGRFIAEGDFEEQRDGIRIYDTRRNHTFHTLGKEETFVGWDSISDLFFTTNGKFTKIWDAENGEVLRGIDVLKDYAVEQMVASQNGAIVLVIWGTSEGVGTPVNSHLTILRIPKEF